MEKGSARRESAIVNQTNIGNVDGALLDSESLLQVDFVCLLFMFFTFPFDLTSKAARGRMERILS